jgi:hypothetical protein
MPKVSEREKVLKMLRRLLSQHLDTCSKLVELDAYTDDEEEMTSVLFFLFASVSSLRYFKARDFSIPKGACRVLWFLESMSEEGFRQEFRMSRKNFWDLESLISKDNVFKASTKPMAPAHVQLLVTLSQLGFSGNGVSKGKVSRWHSLGYGTVTLYFRRIISSIHSLRNQIISWPNNAQRHEISKSFEEKSGFRNCIGLIDGTLFPLYCKPLKDGEAYYTRKGNYAINGMVVCNHRKQITYLNIGWPGSTHDARVFKNSMLFLKQKQYFNSFQYLLADSAYPPETFVVPTYKKPNGGTMSSENERFNLYHANTRIGIEHCIGMLKGRFQSLKELRYNLREEKDMHMLILHIEACAIIHNLCINDFDNKWMEDIANSGDEIHESCSLQSVNASESIGSVSGKQFREYIKQDVLQIRVTRKK